MMGFAGDDEWTFEEEPNAVTAVGLRALYDEMRRSEARWFPLFAVIAFTGLRFCEAAALRWGDVDLSSGALRIRRAIYRGLVGEPKTHTRDAASSSFLPRCAPSSGTSVPETRTPGYSSSASASRDG